MVLDRREHLIGVATSLEQRVENRLVVAIDELYPEHALGALFAEFARAFPYVELELLFPLMEDVSRMVQSGAADLGVMWRQEVLPTELASRPSAGCRSSSSAAATIRWPRSGWSGRN